MKYIKSINEFKNVSKFKNEFTRINEEWFPYDIWLRPKDESKSDSYLEFEGEYLKEILGKNRNLKVLVENIKDICNDPESIDEKFEAVLWDKKSDKDEDTKTRQVKGFKIQINESDDKNIEILSELGEISKTENWIILDLNHPIQLTFKLKYDLGN